MHVGNDTSTFWTFVLLTFQDFQLQTPGIILKCFDDSELHALLLIPSWITSIEGGFNSAESSNQLGSG